MPPNTGFSDLPAREVQRFTLDSNAASIDLVPAVEGRAVRLLSLVLSQGALGVGGSGSESSGSGLDDGRVVFRSASTEIGAVVFDTNSAPLVLPSTPDGWMQTAPGEKLVLSNEGQLSLQGFGSYVML